MQRQNLKERLTLTWKEYMSPGWRDRASATDSLQLCKQWELPDVHVVSSAEKDERKFQNFRHRLWRAEEHKNKNQTISASEEGNYVDMYGQIKPGVTDTFLGVTFTAACLSELCW